jgi:hypothetical protein
VTLGQPHPTKPGVLCDSRTPNHPECSGWDDVLDSFIDWPNPDHIPSRKLAPSRTTRKERLQTVAARTEAAPRVQEVTSGFPAGLAGSQSAARAWTEQERQAVDDAIRTVAQRHAGGGEFTSDAVWELLDGAVPVTKGLTARLMVASRAGLIDTTGKFEISQRGGHHDHGQRLSVWYSLITQ